MGVRDKILRRLANLIRLAKSPNPHEARLARERADELVKNHQVTEVELAGVSAEPAEKKHPRFAGSVTEEPWWKEQLAFACAYHHHCKPLKAQGRIFFDGEAAHEAVALYRRVADEIDGSLRTYLQEYQDGRFWNRVFLLALDPDTNPRHLSLYGRTDRMVRLVWRAATESMSLHNGLATVTSRQPGSYATLFSPAGKFVCRGDLSVFDDSAGKYKWVFEQRGALARGDYLVFATSDREIVGELTGTWVRILSRAAHVARAGTGEPVAVERI